MTKYLTTTIPLSKLKLDSNNPRFAELYSDSWNESDLINYLLYNESWEEIALAIIEEWEFYQDRPLWVIEEENMYLVKDGNRRCAAVKALQEPSSYGLKCSNFKTDELPVLVYKRKEDVEQRIIKEHSNNTLFKSWWRIAKALEVYRIFNLWKSEEELITLWGDWTNLVKLASFYYEAVKIWWDKLKKRLREWKGGNWWKTIIFERLFQYQTEKCWYKFQKKPHYTILITDLWKFTKFIESILLYFEDKAKEISHHAIDKEKEQWFYRLQKYWFDIDSNPSKEWWLFLWNTNEDIAEDIKSESSFKNEQTSKSGSVEPISEEITLSSLQSSKGKIRPKSSTRNYLIPKTCLLSIKETKVNNVYRELRDDLLLDDSKNAVPNAVWITFRVFLELSLDCYANKNWFAFSPNNTIKEKISKVIDSLVSKWFERKKFNNINKVWSSTPSHSYLSIDNFHEYVHSLHTQPTSSELKTKRDNLEEFFIIIWSTL